MKSTDSTSSYNILLAAALGRIFNKIDELIHKFRLDKQARLIIGIILCVSLFFILFNCLLQVIIHFSLFEEVYFKLNLDSGEASHRASTARGPLAQY